MITQFEDLDPNATYTFTDEQKKYIIDNVYASKDIIKVHVFEDMIVDLTDVFENY